MMPRIQLVDAYRMPYCIDTRRDGTLSAWFDEVLPLTRAEHRGKPLYPQIMVQPLLIGDDPPDWLTDTRVIGNAHMFRAANGAEALTELAGIRAMLESDLRTMRL